MKAICGFCKERGDVLFHRQSPNGVACVPCAAIVAEAQETDTIGTMAPEQELPF